MDKLRIKIIILTIFILCSTFILSFLNAIISRTDNKLLVNIVEGMNISCAIIAIVILIIMCTIYCRLINHIEESSKHFIINFIIFFSCLVFKILFSFFAYLLIIRRFESNNLFISTLLIFFKYIFRVIIVGSIFMICSVAMNSCYTCFKGLEDERRNSDLEMKSEKRKIDLRNNIVI
jgi:hypothetical protein